MKVLWKTTSDGRQPLMENNLQWKTIFDGRQPFEGENRASKPEAF